MIGDTADLGNKADPAGIVLKAGVIKTVDISLRKVHRCYPYNC